MRVGNMAIQQTNEHSISAYAGIEDNLQTNSETFKDLPTNPTNPNSALLGKRVK
jgi:hypothetical protein